MLVFNMSSLLPNEDVYKAQLHLRRRRMVRQGSTRHQRRMRKTLDPPMHVRLVRVNPHSRRRPTNIASYPVARGERGWRVLDVTAAVRESAAMPSASKQAYLGIRFEEPTRTERRRPRRFIAVPVDDFLQARCANEHVAYLVLYSKETEENADEDEVDYREPPSSQVGFAAEKDDDRTGNDNELKVMITDDFRQPRKLPGSSNYLDAEYDAHNNRIREPGARGPERLNLSGLGKQLGPDGQVRKGGRKQRKGRDVSDNELPGDDDGPIEGTGSIHAAAPTAAFSGHVPEEANVTGLATHLEVYSQETAPPRFSPSANPQVKWNEAEVRRQREDPWEEGARGEGPRTAWEGATGKETGAGSDGDGSEKGRRADGKGTEAPREKYQGSDKAPRRERAGTVPVKDEPMREDRKKGRSGNRSSPWRNFGVDTTTRQKGIRPQVTDGEVLTKQPLNKVRGWADTNVHSLSLGNCSLHRYTIDFHDFGWANWLYGPRLYQSALCTGLCPNHNVKLDGRPTKPEVVGDFYATNHARIQNLFSALRWWDSPNYQPGEFASDRDAASSYSKNHRALLHFQSQDSCCAPNVFAPLVLLYSDENEDFVLRLFPSLKVISCACI
ncbi:uncharacterized protein [Hetaerina americana]|uniref:uncharacterized protein n=1 Tax=Hetaerina americana TaxID=62018 RepID=UPI003A7F1F81